MTETNNLTPAETERFASIMGACGTMWSWWEGVQYHGGSWENPSDVTLTIENPNGGESIVKRLSAKQIVRALGTAKRTVPSFRNIDIYDEYLDLDAGDADVVLQIAVLGEVVYA